MNELQNRILDKQQVLQKTRRMAYEIYENNFEENELILAGIFDRGYLFAEMLVKELTQLTPLKLTLVKVVLQKFTNSQAEIILDCTKDALVQKTVVLVDDVLNTGRTLAYAIKPFLEVDLKKLQTAVIVDRNHKLFPIAADYTGHAISTTIKEHITVVLDNEQRFGVYLN